MNKLKISLIIFLVIIATTVGIMRFIDRTAPINMATKTCLITGASSGIGKALAEEMVARGWKVIGIARRTELLEKLKFQFGAENFIPYVCDVGNHEQIHQISEQIKNDNLKPTLFFLNAGMGDVETKWQVSTTAHRKTFDVNYFGVIAWIEEFLPSVKQLGGGTFVATSSIVALFTPPGAAAYGASKAAIVNAFQALRLRYLNDKIGFSVALPGPVDTDMLKGVKNLPFTHTANYEAHYIIDQAFKGKKQIEPAWFYSTLFRVTGLLPDKITLKLLGS